MAYAVSRYGEGPVRALPEAEERGRKQGDETAYPPAEVWTRDRSSTRPQGAGQRRRLKRRKRTKGVGTGTEIPQGGHQ